MSLWKQQSMTWNAEARRVGGDRAADEANVFRRHGFVDLPKFLGAPAALDYLERHSVARQDPSCPTISRFPVKDLLSYIPLKEYATDPMVMRWAAMHIGAWPVINDVSCWVTHEGDAGDPGAQRWHRDLDDWRAAKLFIYLTDVDNGCGPHEFIPGSHKSILFHEHGHPADIFFVGAGREMMPSIGQILEELPRVRFIGAPGRAWMANTYAFHRGTPVFRKGARRVVFQVMYGLMDLEADLGPGTNIPKIRAAGW